MIKLINKLTGTTMRVAESRAEQYIAAGHVPVAPAPVKRLRRKYQVRKRNEVLYDIRIS